jgi:dihydrofolate reductase
MTPADEAGEAVPGFAVTTRLISGPTCWSVTSSGSSRPLRTPELLGTTPGEIEQPNREFGVIWQVHTLREATGAREMVSRGPMSPPARTSQSQRGPHPAVRTVGRPMRKLVLYTLLSVDGVAESPDRYFFDFDEDMRANLARVIGDQDAVLLGRRTYDEWAGFWPTAEQEPFASFINGTQKYVASSTEPPTPWANTTVIDGSVTEFVRDLKTKPGGRRLFEGGDELRTLELVRSAGTPSGAVLVNYRVVGNG